MRKKLMSPEQAFRAMSIFLKEYYDRTGATSALGAVLSDIQLNRPDGLPQTLPRGTTGLRRSQRFTETKKA